MKAIPDTEHAVVLRTDFSDQKGWEEICTEIQKPVGIFRFQANVDFIDQVEYADITKDQILELTRPHYRYSFIIVVDRIAISKAGHPLLILELFDRNGLEFRAVPSEVQGIENNLSIANMDFEEFVEAADPDSVFRGFPGE